MRIILAVLVLIFSLQSFTKADDISEFEIEGMSLGVSLLKYYKKDEINSWRKTFYPKSDKYFKFDVSSTKGNYDDLSFHVKKNDSKFIIYEIGGGKYFDNKISECNKFKQNVVMDIQNITNDLEKDTFRYYYKTVEDGKSYADIIEFKYPNGDLIRLWCVNWSTKVENKLNFMDNFTISLTPLKHMKWINEEAYK